MKKILGKVQLRHPPQAGLETVQIIEHDFYLFKTLIIQYNEMTVRFGRTCFLLNSTTAIFFDIFFSAAHPCIDNHLIKQ